MSLNVTDESCHAYVCVTTRVMSQGRIEVGVTSYELCDREQAQPEILAKEK